MRVQPIRLATIHAPGRQPRCRRMRSTARGHGRQRQCQRNADSHPTTLRERYLAITGPTMGPPAVVGTPLPDGHRHEHNHPRRTPGEAAIGGACCAKGSSRRWRRMRARHRKQNHPTTDGGGRSILSGRGWPCGSPSRSPAIAASSSGWNSHLAQLDRTKPTRIHAGEIKRGPQQRAGALVLDVAVSEVATGQYLVALSQNAQLCCDA